MGVTELVLSYVHLKLKLGVFLTGYTVATVTGYVKKNLVYQSLGIHLVPLL